MKKVLGSNMMIIEDETGGYGVFVPALPGCHTQGETIEETIGNVKEAIELYPETLQGKGWKYQIRESYV